MENNTNDMIIVFFGELATKGKNLMTFIRALGRNVVATLKPRFSKLSYDIKRDHIYIHLNGEEFDKVKDVLIRIPGILSVSHVKAVAKDIPEIQKYAFDLIESVKPETFKVEVRRVDKLFPMHSDEIVRKVAGYILSNNNTYKVDVHKPELKISIMIREDMAYIYGKKYRGVGGYPVGIQGKCMMLLSGGIDSPVAGYMMLKRGVKLECLHFAAPPYTSEKVIDKLVDLLHKLNFYQEEIKLHIVPFTELQVAIYRNCPNSYAITLLRRMMMRILSIWARKRHCLVAASGESIGQVASQTLQSINTIESVLEVPMIRPLACMDKLDIIKTAQDIDTYDISIRPFEDCCTIFETKDPTTCPRIDKCEEYEANFDYEALIKQCVENIETRVISLKDEEDEEF